MDLDQDPFSVILQQEGSSIDFYRQLILTPNAYKAQEK